MNKIDYQALREKAEKAKELGNISRYTKAMIAMLEFKEAATPDAVLALLDELEASGKRIAELGSLTAPQLPQPAVVVSESQSKKLFDEWSGGDGALGELRASGVPDEFISMLKEFSLATWEACREALLQHHAPFIVTIDHRMMEMPKAEDIGAVAAMLQGAEPETDNTNQQFESLSRGDK